MPVMSKQKTKSELMFYTNLCAATNSVSVVSPAASHVSVQRQHRGH